MDRLRRIVFGHNSDASIDADLLLSTEIDRAHLVMLSEAAIVPERRASALLREIDRLRAVEFAPLRAREASRGLYILYETYLIGQLGADTGGILQTARSRNDVKATLLNMRLRRQICTLAHEGLRLQAVLLRRARRFAAVTMPAYTHHQAALPVTYGHYLTGVATAMDRHINALLRSSRDLDQCPLGAGAAGGTSLPIRPQRTAELLGFSKPVTHSIDAVASRDLVLRSLAEAGILATLLSRVATDFLQWTTREFSFFDLPDELVGRSSMMPQKRNPFFLEHVQGRGASALGTFVTAATAMQAQPFTNSISVGTEAVEDIWPALEHVAEALILLRAVIAAARPRVGNMLRRAVEGYTSATELANRLATRKGMPFRSAYETVGSIVREADVRQEDLTTAVIRTFCEDSDDLCAGLDPGAVAESSRYGGGPGATAACADQLHLCWTAHMRHVSAWRQQWLDARRALDHAVEAIYTRDQAWEAATRVQS